MMLLAEEERERERTKSMTFVYDIPTKKFDEVLKASKVDNPHFSIA